jgi:hypothetical protein
MMASVAKKLTAVKAAFLKNRPVASATAATDDARGER